jgi:hypothetical protein
MGRRLREERRAEIGSSSSEDEEGGGGGGEGPLLNFRLAKQLLVDFFCSPRELFQAVVYGCVRLRA